MVTIFLFYISYHLLFFCPGFAVFTIGLSRFNCISLSIQMIPYLLHNGDRGKRRPTKWQKQRGPMIWVIYIHLHGLCRWATLACWCARRGHFDSQIYANPVISKWLCFNSIITYTKRGSGCLEKENFWCASFTVEVRRFHYRAQYIYAQN